MRRLLDGARAYEYQEWSRSVVTNAGRFTRPRSRIRSGSPLVQYFSTALAGLFLPP